TEGLLPGQGIHDQSIQAEKDLKLMQVSAVAWKNGMGDEWLDAAKKYLFAWVGTYQPNFNPIDETAFDQMIQTYSIVKPKLSEEERRNINKYFYDWASEYISQMNNAPNKSTWTNNWQSHRVKLITLMAVATRNDHLFAESRRLFQEQINV
nr:alginate lyase family protein [Klebsiella pneumoniae]